VGIGGEYAFTDWLSGFAEYDYYDFGNRDTGFVCTPGACVAGAFTYNIKETKSVFKVGLNLRWGGGYGPVVARY
jgi:outer membrane immunogenic protein